MVLGFFVGWLVGWGFWGGVTVGVNVCREAYLCICYCVILIRIDSRLSGGGLIVCFVSFFMIMLEQHTQIIVAVDIGQFEHYVGRPYRISVSSLPDLLSSYRYKVHVHLMPCSNTCTIKCVHIFKDSWGY